MPEAQSSKPPKFVYFIFSAFCLLAAINIISDLNSKGIQPFGFVSEIIAAIRPGANSKGIVKELYSGDFNIQDSTDRCEVIDPNLEGGFSYAGVLGNMGVNSLSENAGGINIGAVIDTPSGLEEKTYRAMMETAERLGMGYVIGMVTDKTEKSIENTVNYIKQASSIGVMPIVRLCYQGPSDNITANCKFNLSVNSGDVIDFYAAVSKKVGSTEFIAMLGPNEPGTAREMEAFGLPAAPGGYTPLIARLNDAAEALKVHRVVNGGNMYLAPGAFNLTNAENNDAIDLTSGTPAIFPDRFDIILGNTYDFPGTPSYEYYVGSKEYPAPDPGTKFEFGNEAGQGRYNVRRYVVDNELKFILSEFGKFNGAPVAQLQQSFDKFCQDDTVDGIMFFRSFDTLYLDGESVDGKSFQPEPHPDFISTDKIGDIISGCSKGSGGVTSSRDFAWRNCNQDTCIYDNYTYSSRSTANVCGVELDRPRAYENNGAALKANCSGGTCTLKQFNTVQVSLPIKQFGNNSPFGTKTKPYTPICVEVGQSVSGSQDALNQFSGKITSSDSKLKEYPMPWLGSAINCSAQLIRYPLDYPGLLDDENETKPHPASGIDVTLKEIQDEIAKPGSKVVAKTFYNVDNSGKTIDERTVCLPAQKGQPAGTENCYDKAESLEFLKSLREYDPFTSRTATRIPLSKSVTSANACGPDFKYDVDEGNYIAGPELVVNDPKTVKTFPSVEVCKDYSKRNTDQSNKEFISRGQIKCGYLQGQVVASNSGSILCPAAFTCANGKVFSKEQYDKDKSTYDLGDCVIPQQYEGCFVYENSYVKKDPNETGTNNSELGAYYKITNSYTDVPEFDIPGVYDSLYRMYLRMQAQLSSVGNKIVFGEDLGWRAKVSSIVRDGNRAIKDPRTNLYGANLKMTTKEDTEAEKEFAKQVSCTVPKNEFKNNYFLAKNNPIKTEYHYYPWLGYLDVMQEIMMVYPQSDFTGPYYQPNPFKDNKDFPEAFRKKEYIVTTGLPPSKKDGKDIFPYKSTASLYLKFPLVTCDDVEILKYDKSISKDLRIDPKRKVTCITGEKDTSFNDELAKFLCKKGYEMAGTCDNPVENSCVDQPAEGEEDGPTPEPGDEEPPTNVSLAYPTSTTTIYSPFNKQRTVGGTTGYHKGVDFAVPIGTPVKAAAAGTVIVSTNGTEGLGSYIKIRHQDGTATFYGHNSKLLVAVGAVVTQGQLIAESGNTGRSTGPHLHFELHKNATCRSDESKLDDNCSIDPEPYLNGTISDDGEVVCVYPEDDNYETGVLNCNVNITNVADEIDFQRSVRQIEARVEAYNLDNNQSYTWLANPKVPENASIKAAMIKKLGSEAAYEQDYKDRVDVTEFLRLGAISRGINPRLAFALWVEETAGSAVGNTALGCGPSFMPHIPYGQGKKEMVVHIRQQLDCMKWFIDSSTNFAEFTCSYSGEVAKEGTVVRNVNQPIVPPGIPGLEGKTQMTVGIRECDITKFQNNPNFPTNLCKYYNFEPI